MLRASQIESTQMRNWLPQASLAGVHEMALKSQTIPVVQAHEARIL